MRMTIKNIECTDKCTYVTGDTDVGSVKGIWYNSELPILNGIYFIELNIGEIDRNEILVIDEADFYPCVSSNGKQVLFKGIWEEIDDVYVIRFAIDWIEMIEINNDDFTIRKGDVISFTANCASISIYPYLFD